MSEDFIHDTSTLVQVMAWCCQATSHYLSQCWPIFMLPYGITRPQWVNSYTSDNLKLSLISIITGIASDNKTSSKQFWWNFNITLSWESWSTLFLLMPWLQPPPGHQSGYWLRQMCILQFYLKCSCFHSDGFKDLLCLVSRNDTKCKFCLFANIHVYSDNQNNIFVHDNV